MSSKVKRWVARNPAEWPSECDCVQIEDPEWPIHKEYVIDFLHALGKVKLIKGCVAYGERVLYILYAEPTQEP